MKNNRLNDLTEWKHTRYNRKTLKINQLYQNISYKSTIIEEKYKVVGVWFTNRSLDFTQKSFAALYVQNLSQSRSVSTVDKLKETKGNV